MKIKFTLFLLLATSLGFSQIGIGTATPNTSAELDVTSTTKGVLIPRMTSAQRGVLASPVAGLMVYQTNNPGQGFWYYNGTTWLQTSTPSWDLTGNTGTVATTNYLGTTDARPIVFRTNGVERMRLQETTGNLGIGTNNPTTKLHLVSAGGLVFNNGFEGGTIAPLVNGTTTGGAWSVTTAAAAVNTGTRGLISGGFNVANALTQVVYNAAVGGNGGTITFDYKVSTESGYDFFNFYINGGAPLISQSGTVGWTTVSFPLAAGANNIVWEYDKDGSVNSPFDSCYLDNVIFSNNAAGLRIVDGAQGLGKVLISDATGLATWGNPAAPSSVTTWATNGNTGTAPATNYVGTTDARDFVIRTNSVEAARVSSAGNVGIGTTTPTSKLHVEADLDNQPVIRGRNINTTAGTASNGIRGEAISTQLGSAAVVGYSNGGSGPNEIGVLGDYDLWGAAVLGLGSGGAVTDMIQFRDYGVFGTVNSSVGTGVYGRNINTSATAWGMYSEGNFAVTGTKSASVPTTKGNQLVYCTESPELWFEDLGFGETSNGETHIRLDDMFLETVYIDTTHKIHVFIQESGESNGLFVRMDADNKGFTVKEKNNGTSNSEFSYRIIAKRRFYQDQRFGVDANQPFENNLAKAKDIPVTTTDPEEMKRFVEQEVAKKNAAYAAEKK